MNFQIKRRGVAIALAAATALTLSACGGGSDAPTNFGAAGVPPAAESPVNTTTPPPGTGTTPVGTTPVGTPTTPVVTTPTAPITALDAAKQFLADYDAQRATALPATATASFASLDTCYLSGGSTKGSLISEFNADTALAISSNQAFVGATRNNAVVTAERNTTNADGSTRREIDIQFQVNYVDGSVDRGPVETLISGSSSGSCATPQNSAALRFFGDRRLVGVGMQGRITRNANFYRTTTTIAVSTAPVLSYPTTTVTNAVAGSSTLAYVVPAGAPFVFTPVSYRRDVVFGIRDPGNNATYAIVTGPGSFNVSGVQTLFSVKMLSPRILRDNALLAGKLGNFTNWRDDDTFRLCRSNTAGNVIGAAAADCTAFGAAGNNVGANRNPSVTSLTEAQADATFDSFGFQAGTYTFAIYNDDGWTTVNGQAGKTPVATYAVKLDKLPYSFAQMGTTDPSTDKFPRATTTSFTPTAIANALQLSVATPFIGTWIAPVSPDADLWRLINTGEYFEGAKTTNAPGAAFPAMRFFNAGYPGSTALTGPFAVSARPADIAAKTYSEFSLTYTNRNNSRIISNAVFN